MSEEEVPENIRAELIRLCEKSKCRISEFSRERPTHWSPGTVVDPRNSDGNCFTDNTAWDFIAECLKKGHPVKKKVLKKPPGKIGYVMQIPQSDGKIIYIKLQLAPPGVVGRSFHYSDFDQKS